MLAGGQDGTRYWNERGKRQAVGWGGRRRGLRVLLQAPPTKVGVPHPSASSSFPRTILGAEYLAMTP